MRTFYLIYVHIDFYSMLRFLEGVNATKRFQQFDFTCNEVFDVKIL